MIYCNIFCLFWHKTKSLIKTTKEHKQEEVTNNKKKQEWQLHMDVDSTSTVQCGRGGSDRKNKIEIAS